MIIVPAALLIRRPPHMERAAAPDAHGSARAANGVGMGRAARRRNSSSSRSAFFFCCAAHSGPIFHTVSYAMICGAPALAAASIYSVEGLAGLGGRMLFGVAADRLGVKRVLIAGLADPGHGDRHLHLSEPAPHFYVLAVVLGAAYGGVMPLYSVLARGYFSPSIMGRLLGAAIMASSLGMSFGPFAGGWLYDQLRRLPWLYLGSAAVGLAAVAIAFTFPKPTLRLDTCARAGLTPFASQSSSDRSPIDNAAPLAIPVMQRQRCARRAAACSFRSPPRTSQPRISAFCCTKHPDRAHETDLGFGKAIVSIPKRALSAAKRRWCSTSIRLASFVGAAGARGCSINTSMIVRMPRPRFFPSRSIGRSARR